MQACLSSPSVVENSREQRDHGGMQKSGHYKLEEENHIKETDASPRTVYGVQREQS